MLVNGQAREFISVHDRGLQYGDGLFETIAVAAGEPLLWERHMRRLQRGCACLGIAAPDVEQLRGEVQHLGGARERAVVKVVVTRGTGTRGYAPPADAAPTRIVSVSDWPPRAGIEEGVAVQFCRTHLGRNPALAGLKHLNRLEQVLARAELGAGVAEGLMLDDRGQVIEGTMSNLFAACGGEWVTPDLSECGVAGVLREFILEHAPTGVRVAPLTPTTLAQAAEIFLSNSIIGVWPVRKLAETVYPVGPMTRAIQQMTRDLHAVA